MIRGDWGRLVAPGDPAALAGAIDELLDLPMARRAAMGRAGRAFVLAHCDVRAETAKLAALFGRSAGRAQLRGRALGGRMPGIVCGGRGRDRRETARA